MARTTFLIFRTGKWPAPAVFQQPSGATPA
jgi:hypothetical protein